ncbi:MAG: beta-ketoacyl-[acyl-carrier-protein] synthase family protein, partial [Bacillota bacterium]
RFWEGVLHGRSRIRKLDRFDASTFRTQVAAQVDDFDPSAYLDRKQLGRMDRFVQFSLVSAMQALGDAGITPSELHPERVGVFMGSALGGVGFGEEQHAAFMGGGLRAVNPGLALTVFGGAASCAIAIHYGFQGPNETNGMSCASGAIAVGRGLQAIRRGEADVVIAGGAEAPLWPLCYGAFANIRAMSTRNQEPESACRPFDAERDGFVMGEGAAVLIIEERSRALRRGARPYAELVGYGTSNDGYHMTAPRPDGSQAARAMMHALRDANLPGYNVGYINAHASATPLNDVTEALAIRRALGVDASVIPVSGTKGLYGHPLGASGAIEAALTALALYHGYLPPTVNLRRQDPEVPLSVLSGQGLERRPRRALSNSFGFGGINACLALAEA